MYTNENLEVVHNHQPYTGSNGTSYPRNFPKSEIAELYPVVETPRPTDNTLEVTGYHIEKQGDAYVQVWTTREKTEEELTAPLRAEAHAALLQSDRVALRCVKAGVAFPSAWQQYVIDLRAVINGALTVLPVQPDYPAGT